MSLSSVSPQHVLSLCRFRSNPGAGSREPRAGLTIPGGRNSAAAERFPRVGRSESPQPERGRDSGARGVPVGSSASGFPGPPQREPQGRAEPGTAADQGNCSPGRPGAARGRRAGLPAACHCALVSSLSVSPKGAPPARRRLQDLAKVRAAAA